MDIETIEITYMDTRKVERIVLDQAKFVAAYETSIADAIKLPVDQAIKSIQFLPGLRECCIQCWTIRKGRAEFPPAHFGQRSKYAAEPESDMERDRR